jgi:hypothetical protein
MIITLLLMLDVLLVGWLVLAVVREAKPGGQVRLGWLAYKELPDQPQAEAR